MIIRPHDSANGMQIWIAEGATEHELDEGLKLGYIMWHSVRLDISKVTAWPSESGLATRLVHVSPPTQEQLDILNQLLIRDLQDSDSSAG